MKSILLLMTATAAAATSCRCFPGDACWPSTAIWNRLNQSVDGRLIATVPLGSPCHSPNYDPTLCEFLSNEWDEPATHYQTSSSIMSPFFTNGSCDPFHPVSQPCTLGDYVRYAVNVSSPDHVAKTLSFANTHNIRLVTRNTGHDYLGKSTGAGALAIWTHNLKTIDFIHNYSDASYTGPAIKMGAGVQGFEAYEAADTHNYQVVTGSCPTVGIAGGYTQGGGHSPLASRYGLAADQVLAWEVIDSKGNFITATSNNAYSDLYWALSGGGGGTYGVVWSLTSKAHPATPVSGLNITFSSTGISKDTFYEGVALSQTILPAAVDAGVVSITVITNTSLSMGPFHGPNIPVADLVRLVKPFTDGLTKLGINYTMFSAQFPNYVTEYTAMQFDVAVNTDEYGGWLVPRSVVETNNDALTAAYRFVAEDGVTISAVALNVSKEVTPDNAVLPAWRDAIIHTIFATPWEFDDIAAMRVWQHKMTNEYVARLEALAPESGAYMNEGDFRQPNFQKAFFGRNYGRLRAIKAKYDPDDLFYARTAVGSDEWTVETDGRLCRVK